MIFDSDALYLCLTNDLKGHTSPASASLERSILKKFQDDIEPDADRRAIEKFLLCNSKCRKWHFYNVKNATSRRIILHAKHLLSQWLSFSPNDARSIFSTEWLDKCVFGPGASIGSSDSNFLTKISHSILTGTSASLYSLFIKSLAQSSPTWLMAERSRRDEFGGVRLVRHNKLSCVPKTRYISRCIATEPSLNMFIQKGLQSWLEDRLRHAVGTALDEQPSLNQDFARKGSIDGSYGTIDLASASDTISLWFSKFILPSDVYQWLRLARSPSTVTPDGTTVPLYMISSMGNATTFPLQTILFSALVVATYRDIGIRCELGKNRNFGVFGDDIVVCRRAYDTLMLVLRDCGFEPNFDKSYNDGPFRESCGEDYHNGVNIRGVYCKSLRKTHDYYSLINRLNIWSAKHRISLSWTVAYLMTLLSARTKEILRVPLWEDVCSGLRFPLDNVPMKGYLYKYTYLRCTPVDICVEEARLKKGPSKLVKTRLTEGALLTCLLRGVIRNGRINVRSNNIRFTLGSAVTPCWDYLDRRDTINGGVTVHALKNAIRINLLVYSGQY